MTCSSIRALHSLHRHLPRVLSTSSPSFRRQKSALSFTRTAIADLNRRTTRSSSFSAFSHPGKSGSGRRKSLDMSDDRERTRGRGGRGGDRIDALGRLLTRILRHVVAELNLNMRSDGYVKVQDLLQLDIKTFADVQLRAHTVDEIKEAVRRDNKQRFSLLEENGELLIRANQGHSVKAMLAARGAGHICYYIYLTERAISKEFVDSNRAEGGTGTFELVETVESDSLLEPILSAEEVPVCVHGTYKKNLQSILDSGLKRMERLHVHFSSGLPADGEVISGMRKDVNVLIFLDIRKALEDGMKIYISDNRVILTEGFDGVVPVKYFDKILSWPDKQVIPFERN